MRRIVTGLVMLFAVAAVGCAGTKPAFLRPAAVPVPPSQEIEILDPAQGATHVPAVVLAGGTSGTQHVDVAPSVLVHRYYPSGDRTFQAQFVPGGPTILSLNHPKTLERTYVMATMPPGAPRVTYAGKSIIYDFGAQSVTVHFGPLGCPTVSYSQSTKLVAGVGSIVEKVKEHFADRAARKGTGEVVRE